MKRLNLLSLCLFFAPAALSQGYSYWYTESFLSNESSNWTANNLIHDSSAGLLLYSGQNPASLISTLVTPYTPPPGNAGMYEVETTLSLSGTGGTFVTYLDATSNALSASGSSTGTFYSAEFTPTFSGGLCSATVVINKVISGSVTQLSSVPVACAPTTIIRSVRAWNFVQVYINGIDAGQVYDSTIASGQPGVGISGGSYPYNYLTSVGLGSLDEIAPNPVSASTIAISSFSNRIDMQWRGTSDNASGSGLAMYALYRNGSYIGTMSVDEATSYSDTTVSPGTNYTYTIYAYDYHLNSASTSFGVTTPPSGSVDPRQTGVRPTGAYWGANPEQVNLLSGNLTFSLPLIQAEQRGGSSVGFSLNYNSQNWRKDAGGTWNLGTDVGLGYGWRLLAGSITPYWSDYSDIDHYTFTDSTGGEYRLSINNGSNVWSSPESIYIQYDANTSTLYFPNGTFWIMGCESAGSEQDAGTFYPTVMEDTNGNQILMTYNEGHNTWWPNSSSRILTIEDTRATDNSGVYSSYQLTYNSDTPPHLTSIANTIGTGETYNFSYSSFTLEDPFSSSSFGTVKGLTQVSLPNDSSASYNFTADSSGDLTKAQLLYGGYIRWTYSPFTYTGSRQQMEIAERYLSKDGTSGSEQGYPITHESDDGAHTIHAQTTINDPGGVGQKYWAFSQSGANLGLATTYQGNDLSAGATKIQNAYAWNQDTLGNNYVGTLVTTLDPGKSYAVSKTTTQTLDTSGNVTALTNYDYGGAYRTYAYSYLNTSSYTSRYIFNRLSGSTVTTDGIHFTTLNSVTYDGSALTGSATPIAWDSNYTSVTARGNATSVTDVSGITTSTAYDLYGNLASSTNANGVTNTAVNSSTTNYSAPDSVTVSGSLTTGYTYSSFLGTTSGTGPNGDTVDIGYDSNARPTSTTSPFGATTYTTYTDTGSTPNVCSSTNYRWTQNFLDGLGRTIKTLIGDYTYSGTSTCSSGSSYTALSENDNTYASAATSPVGKIATANIPYTYGGSATATTTYTYDGVGRTLSVATVGTDTSATTTYAYAGNVVTVTDPAGKIKVFTTDAFGNLTQVVEDPYGLDYTTSYTYDFLNHLIGVSMPRSIGTQSRSWTYNGNLLTSAANPENGTIQYFYGTNNLVSKRIDNKGQATVYTYDGLARLTEVQHYPSGISGGEDTCQRVNYYYDGSIGLSGPGGSILSENTLGRLSVATYQGGYQPGASPSCNTTFYELYQYNAAGAPTAKYLQVGRPFTVTGVGSGLTFLTLNASYTYDNEGHITGLQYPVMKDQWSITYTPENLSYTYAKMARLDGLTNTTASQTIIAGASYDTVNQVVSITGASGGWGNETRTYNSIKQLTNITSNGVNITYNYPSSGNNGKVQSQTDGLSGETVTYTYDNLNRLINAQSQCSFSTPWGQSFGYDGFSNLTSTSVSSGCSGYSAPTFTQSYDANNHAGGEDANGNPGSTPLPAVGTGSYIATWDVENRMTQAGSGTIFYGYAPNNLRVWRGAGTWVSHSSLGTGSCNTGQWSTDEVTFWGIDGHKLMTYNLVESPSGPYGAECDFTATPGYTNYYFGNRLIKNSTGYVYTDRLGSIGKYYPYGIERSSATTSGKEKFTGYFRDLESGNDYAINRYQSPGFGRFFTPDRYSGSISLSRPGTWNRYAYVGGDPVNRIDPLGLWDTPTVFSGLKSITLGTIGAVAAGSVEVGSVGLGTPLAVIGALGAAAEVGTGIIRVIGGALSRGSQIQQINTAAETTKNLAGGLGTAGGIIGALVTHRDPARGIEIGSQIGSLVQSSVTVGNSLSTLANATASTSEFETFSSMIDVVNSTIEINNSQVTVPANPPADPTESVTAAITYNPTDPCSLLSVDPQAAGNNPEGAMLCAGTNLADQVPDDLDGDGGDC